MRATPADMTFDYWGDRLATLLDVVKRPPPANAIVAWFERHTSERNALTVAILGLFLSVLIGLLSFVICITSADFGLGGVQEGTWSKLLNHDH